MIINVINFGDFLMSHPAGREAFLLAQAYIFKTLKKDEDIILDFNGIKVLGPSWADEFIQGIKANYPNEIKYINTYNPSVSASLETVLSD